MSGKRRGGKRRDTAAVFALSAFVLLAGCGRRDAALGADQVMEQFLTIFYTSDYEDRYTNFEQDKIDSFFRALTPFMTEDCMASLSTERSPYKYDKYAAESGTDVGVAEVTLAPYEGEDVYSYTVALKITRGNRVTESEVTGQITIAGDKEAPLVDSVTVSPRSDYSNELRSVIP